MSSMRRENSRTREGQNSYSGFVRRMVSLPRSILGGFSRAMGQGTGFLGSWESRAPIFHPRPPEYPVFPPPPPEYPIFPPHYLSDTVMNNDEWAFLNSFEQNYGARHPFFYACRFVQALKIAQDEKKFLFLYLHSPRDTFAADFCRTTLSSELVVQFIDANFVSWGALSDRGEGWQLGRVLRPDCFPFCAVIGPASDDNIAVLQQIEGPVSPAELVEILQRTLEEQGIAFGSARAKEEEKRRADRRLREEQDAAYFAALSIDQEREKLRKSSSDQQAGHKPVAATSSSAAASAPASDRGFSKWPKHNPILNRPSQVKESSASKREIQQKSSTSGTKDNQVTQIQIRFPNGERRERSFSTADKVHSVYKFIDSLNIPGLGSYRLISSFPRKIYGADQMNMSLRDADLYPRASLFVDLS